MKKVYYYNEKLNIVITREEIINFIHQGHVMLHCRKPISPVCVTEEVPLKFGVETYTYNVLEIPIHKDWEVIVRDDDSLSEKEISDIVYQMSRGYHSCKNPVVKKLTKTLAKLQEFRYKGIKFD